MGWRKGRQSPRLAMAALDLARTDGKLPDHADIGSSPSLLSVNRARPYEEETNPWAGARRPRAIRWICGRWSGRC